MRIKMIAGVRQAKTYLDRLPGLTRNEYAVLYTAVNNADLATVNDLIKDLLHHAVEECSTSVANRDLNKGGGRAKAPRAFCYIPVDPSKFFAHIYKKYFMATRKVSGPRPSFVQCSPRTPPITFRAFASAPFGSRWKAGPACFSYRLRSLLGKSKNRA